jgi:hypothetical protein
MTLFVKEKFIGHVLFTIDLVELFQVHSSSDIHFH